MQPHGLHVSTPPSLSRRYNSRTAACAQTGGFLARPSPLNQPLLTPEELPARLPELYAAIDQFNCRWYFQSHETLEDLWMVTPLPDRDFMQAIIQLAAAFVHYARGEQPGMVKLLDAASAKLHAFAPQHLRVRTDLLLADIDRVRERIVALGPERIAEFPEDAVPSIQLAPPA